MAPRGRRSFHGAAVLVLALTLAPGASATEVAGDQAGPTAPAVAAGAAGSVVTSFPDVPPGAPFFAEVTWLAGSGVTAGYSDGTFRPTAPVTRQAMAAFLYRLVGEPAFEAPTEASFSDVPVGAPFFAQVEWLADTGITAGYTDGTFRPTAPVTRQAMAAFLVRTTPYLGRGFRDVATGWFHTLAVTAGSGVVAWGRNDEGQLGDGTTESRATPVPVPGLTDIVGVEGTRFFSVALSGTGEVYTWGGVPLTPAAQGYLTSPTLMPDLSDVIAIDAGADFVVALTEAGTVLTWGGNQYGQLGDGTTEARPTPKVVPGLSDVVAVAAGDLHVVALTAGGRVHTWGWNQPGTIGDGTTTNRLSPVLLAAPTQVVAVSAGTWQSFAVTADGTAWGWGDNYYGQLGIGAADTERYVPTAIADLTDLAAVEGGVWHTLGLTSDGRLHAWGWNEYGQVGVETGYTWSRPVLLDLPRVDVMAGGWGHSAVLMNGRILTWGLNAEGQLGDGSTDDRAWAGPFVTLGG